ARKRGNRDQTRTGQGIVVGSHKGGPPRPFGTPWMWTLAFGHHEDRRPTHGYKPTREAAMTVFVKSWRAGVAATPSQCCTLARCLTCETLGHARAHGCRTPLVSRFVVTRVPPGRFKHGLSISFPTAP